MSCGRFDAKVPDPETFITMYSMYKDVSIKTNRDISNYAIHLKDKMEAFDTHLKPQIESGRRMVLSLPPGTCFIDGVGGGNLIGSKVGINGKARIIKQSNDGKKEQSTNRSNERCRNE